MSAQELPNPNQESKIISISSNIPNPKIKSTKPPDKLTIRQLLAIEMFVNGKTWDDITRDTGASSDTLSKWRKKKIFMDEILKRKKILAEEAMMTCKEDARLLGPLAVLTLKKAMELGSIKAAQVVAASLKVFQPETPKESEVSELDTISFGNFSAQDMSKIKEG